MTRAGPRLVCGALVPALLLGAAACAPLFDHPKPVEIRPVETPSADGVAPDDNAYRSATKAIEDRDYALALDDLQAARERQPKDVRVLNAFGVVYDKLGRFDLSARYYAQARTIEPRSTIVLANIAYSHALQGLAVHEPATTAVAEATPLRPDSAAPEPAPQPRPASGARSAQLDAPARIAASTNMGGLAPAHGVSGKPLLTGHPLSIVNASGRKGATDAIRRRLVHLGWTAPRWAARDGAHASRTTLFYAQPYAEVARALAHTLRFAIRLSNRSCGCGGLELVVGADFLHGGAFADNLESGRDGTGGTTKPAISKEHDHVPAKA